VPAPSRRPLAVAALAALVVLAGCSDGADGDAASSTSDVRVVQLGAPGEESRELTPEDIAELEVLEPSESDIEFVQAMVPHHQQALQMTSLVYDRTDNPDLELFVQRMDISQQDEIALMEDWLLERGEVFGSDGMHHTGELMPGMLTEEQLAELEAAEGEEFDRLFLESMINHHLGAIGMVEDLVSAEDGGQDAGVFRLAQHIDSDQRIEISRMEDMLAELEAR
jgi:uncharacterized protein (DUF305 family)